MFDDFSSFDPAFENSPVVAADPRLLRRRKTLKQRFMYLVVNLLALPVICLVYATVIADGIRLLMPIFQRRLYQLPIPGAGLARNYDGWNRADLAIIVAILLFFVVTWLWAKIFTELQGYGTVLGRREQSPIVFGLLSFTAIVLIVLDGAIFYFGLASQMSSGWTDGPEYVVPAATLLYTCGLAMLGWYHSDYHTSQYV